MKEEIEEKITLEELAARLERLESSIEEMTGGSTLRDYVAAKKFVRGIKGGPKWTELAKEIHTIGRKYGVLVDYELRTLSPDGRPVQCTCNCDCCCEAVA